MQETQTFGRGEGGSNNLWFKNVIAQKDYLHLTITLLQGVSQLTEGLDSLERGYLLARDQHKLLQQQGAEISHFDPER